MIRHLQLWDFKNFENADLEVGPFTVILGINASGKSNIRDAFRFLHGVGRGYSFAEIIGGKYGAGGQSEWAQMRGAASEIIRFGEDSFQLEVTLELLGRKFVYSILIEQRTARARRTFFIGYEQLEVDGIEIYTNLPGSDDPVEHPKHPDMLDLRMAKTGNQRRRGARVSVRSDQPALTQLPDQRGVTRAHKDLCEEVIEVLGSIRFLDLSPELMRKAAFPGQTVLGDNGENLPTVLQGICADTDRKNVLAEWISELTPMDVIDFKFPVDFNGTIQLVLVERNGAEVSSNSASDGTLRFLAMLAALLGDNPAKLYFFEELDNGIHPARLRLMLDLIEAQTGKGEVQVITTTHSPEFLSMVGDATFEYSSVVFRAHGANSADVTRLNSFPNIAKLRETQGLGSLHSSGWMEDMVEIMAPPMAEERPS